ncbi:MAG: stage 0 sporulation family protein [Candidatus Binatia bacterium]
MDQQPSSPSSRKANLVGVQFQAAGQIRDFDPGPLTLRVGDQVLVEAEHGHMLGTVIAAERPAVAAGAPPPRVIKKADARDLDKDDRNRLREREALRLCLQQVRDRGLQMKLIQVEQAYDGGKITFYFSAEKRVDFRDLVRDLAHSLHTRIEMKQIGARDEAKLIGAVGPCGRELCCSSWMRDFGVVSVKMAKAQGLSLNPSKLAGMCGRLKCCLRYEYDTYLELGRALPAIGSSVESVKGEGVVTRHNILKQTVLIRRADGVEAEASLEDLVEKKVQ